MVREQELAYAADRDIPVEQSSEKIARQNARQNEKKTDQDQ